MVESSRFPVGVGAVKGKKSGRGESDGGGGVVIKKSLQQHVGGGD